MTFTEKIRGLTSRRVTDIEQPTEEPSRFQTEGGWGNAEDATGLPLDPHEAERSARSAGISALVELERQRIERLTQERDAKLGNARRGYDFDKGLNY
jgi:hypothetical protein